MNLNLLSSAPLVACFIGIMTGDTVTAHDRFPGRLRGPSFSLHSCQACDHFWPGLFPPATSVFGFGAASWTDCVTREIVVEQIIELPYRNPLWRTPMPVFVPVPAAAAAPHVMPALGNRGLEAGLENFARKRLADPKRLAEPNRNVRDIDAFGDAEEIRRRARVLKTSTPAGRTRADRQISVGDQAFADQIFARATARYRDAIAKAPDYAAPHFRLAHAYVATRQYNLALNSVLVALELSGTSRRAGFSLEDMYQGDQLVRQQHLNRLLDASRREPDDGGLRFLIGFTLHYDGQPLKARSHFRAAQNLEGSQSGYARYFLPIQPVAEAK